MLPNSAHYAEDFLRRHGLHSTEAVEAESKAIHWASAGNVLVNQGFARLTEADFIQKPAAGFVLHLLHRAFEHLEAAIVAFVTGSGASSESLSRVTVELSVSIQFILAGQQESRLLAFFGNYNHDEEKRLRNWWRTIEALPETEKSEHAKAIGHRQNAVASIAAILARLHDEFRGAGISLAEEAWPNVATRFEKIGDAHGYRTLYSRMSSQVHSDAEETIRYFLGRSANNEELFERMAAETIAFSRFMLYFGVKYFLKAHVAFAAGHAMTVEAALLDRGLEVVDEELKAIAPMVDG